MSKREQYECVNAECGNVYEVRPGNRPDACKRCGHELQLNGIVEVPDKSEPEGKVRIAYKEGDQYPRVTVGGIQVDKVVSVTIPRMDGQSIPTAIIEVLMPNFDIECLPVPKPSPFPCAQCGETMEKIVTGPAGTCCSDECYNKMPLPDYGFNCQGQIIDRNKPREKSTEDKDFQMLTDEQIEERKTWKHKCETCGILSPTKLAFIDPDDETKEYCMYEHIPEESRINDRNP